MFETGSSTVGSSDGRPPWAPYVVDFLCLEDRLVVELDGGQHAEQQAKDEARSAQLAEWGFRVLRFWNHEVLGNTEGVLRAIREALNSAGPPRT